jgi:hypothetical protein
MQLVSLKFNLDLKIVVASFLVLRQLLLEEQQLRVGQVHQQPQRHIKQLPGVQGVKKMFPEMEVTELILAKVYRCCQLSNHSRGFWLGYRFLNP